MCKKYTDQLLECSRKTLHPGVNHIWQGMVNFESELHHFYCSIINISRRAQTVWIRASNTNPLFRMTKPCVIGRICTGQHDPYNKGTLIIVISPVLTLLLPVTYLHRSSAAVVLFASYDKKPYSYVFDFSPSRHIEFILKSNYVFAFGTAPDDWRLQWACQSVRFLV